MTDNIAYMFADRAYSEFRNISMLVRMLTGGDDFYTGNITMPQLAAADRTLGDIPFRDVVQRVLTGHVGGFEAVENILREIGVTTEESPPGT